MRRALLIAGPTASGKSAVALRLAERFGATIVNADSMQVYADLRILTARPTAIEDPRRRTGCSARSTARSIIQSATGRAARERFWLTRASAR